MRKKMGLLAERALKAIHDRGSRVDDLENTDQIGETFVAIDKEYKPGLIGWIQGDHRQWERMISLEERIEQAALAGDTAGLTAALQGYRDFFREMGRGYEHPGTLPLFGAARKEGGERCQRER